MIQQSKTIDPRHLDIGYDQIKGLIPEAGDGLAAILDRLDLVPFPVQHDA
jgi:hypothetical protein